jgi:hypothetical protein
MEGSSLGLINILPQHLAGRTEGELKTITNQTNSMELSHSSETAHCSRISQHFMEPEGLL